MKKEEVIPKIQFEKRNAALDEIPKILSYFLSEISLCQHNFNIQPENSENLHQLRIKIRQYRSILSFFKPFFYHEKYLMAQETWKRAGQKYAYLRELDVLIAEWQKTVTEYPDYFAKDNALEKLLCAKRTAEMNKLCKLDKEAQNIYSNEQYDDLENLIGSEVSQENYKQNISLDRFVKKRTEKWLGKIRKDFQTMEVRDIDVLHALRIRSKKIRYVLEVFTPIEKEHNKKNLDFLKKLQEQLGEICDIKRNIAAMREFGEEQEPGSVQFQMGVFTGMQSCRAERLFEQLKLYKPRI